MTIGEGLRKNLRHPYNRRHPVSAIGRYLEWKFRRHLGRPWIRRFWNSRDVTLYPDSSESMWLLYNVVMDWPEFPFLESYLRLGDTVIDIGANIGIYALWMSRFIGTGGTLIAFEPSRECFSRLSSQMLQNGLARIVLERKAIANFSGPMRLTSGMDMENHVLLEADPSGSAESVEAVTLDDYSRSASIAEVNFLKIDVEGAEPLVIDGADALLREKRIAVMQFEVGEHWSRYGGNLATVAQRLESYGYAPFAPDDTGKGISGTGDWNAAVRGQNLFVARSIAEVSERLASIRVPPLEDFAPRVW